MLHSKFRESPTTVTTSTSRAMSTGSLARAGNWFLQSGIQEQTGGVARYYLVGEGRNLAVSTEITGYAVSTLTYLYELTGQRDYLIAAKRAARFLLDVAWCPELGAMPFEVKSEGGELSPSYFFDCGIIVRGWLALYRLTGERELLEASQGLAEAMAKDFAAGEGSYYPRLALPSKQPLPLEPRWSRMPGCYQAKSAMAWFDLYQETEQPRYLDLFEEALAYGVRTHHEFLPGTSEPEHVMDRLHAYCYFLEALLAKAHDAQCRVALQEGISRVAGYVRQIAPLFARSDVYAQLLRVRLLAEAAGAARFDAAAAREEAIVLTAFQETIDDPRRRGGFAFGERRGKLLPYANPVSTAFCLQALEAYRQREAGCLQLTRAALI